MNAENKKCRFKLFFKKCTVAIQTLYQCDTAYALYRTDILDIKTGYEGT